jgi:hypothetical protein
MSKQRNLLPVSMDLAKMIEDLGNEITTKIALDPYVTSRPEWQEQFNPPGLYRIMCERLEDSDVLVTEATTPSYASAWMIDLAIKLKKPLLTLHYGIMEKVPIMMQGRAKEINLQIYTEETARAVIKKFFQGLKGKN